MGKLKGIEARVLGILLALAVFAILLFVALYISGGIKEGANPVLGALNNLTGVFK